MLALEVEVVLQVVVVVPWLEEGKQEAVFLAASFCFKVRFMEQCTVYNCFRCERIIYNVINIHSLVLRP